MVTGSAHDSIETRDRLRAAQSADEFAAWRDLPPRLFPVEPAPLPVDIARLLHRLRLRYFREAAPAILARAAEEGWDHAQVLKVLLAEEAAGQVESFEDLHDVSVRLHHVPPWLLGSEQPK